MMQTNSAVTLFEGNVETIDLTDVPAAVDGCLSNLTDVQKKVSEAISKAATSKSLSTDAKAVTLKWYKIGDKAKAIEALQTAMVGVADAQGDQAAAIKMLLDYQQTVAKGMKFLLALGVYNVANSRTVVKQLEMRLKNASEEEIGEMARNEVRAVIAQIKAQLDLQEQQTRLAEAHKRVKVQVSVNERGIASLAEHEQRQDMELKAHRQAGERLERELERQAQKDKEHDVALQNQRNKDKEHDAELKRQSQKDAEHDAELKRQADKDIEHDTELRRQAEKDIEHDARIVEIQKVLKDHQFALDTADKVARMSKLSLVLAAVSLIISIVTAILIFLKD